MVRARARINARIRRLSIGNPGDTRSVGGGVSEVRIDYGPGHRVYFVRRREIAQAVGIGSFCDSRGG
jgi:putative addiction module killer protein